MSGGAERAPLRASTGLLPPRFAPLPPRGRGGLRESELRFAGQDCSLAAALPSLRGEGRAPLEPSLCATPGAGFSAERGGERRERRGCGSPCARRRRDARLRKRGRDANGRRASPRRADASVTAGGDAGRHVGDAGRGAGGESELGGVAEVEGVRAHDDRTAARRRLDQVLAAERREAAAEQGDVGERVPGRHLEHRVAEPHVGVGGCGGPLVAGPGAAPRQREAGIGDQLGDGLEALRMARHDDQQRPRRGDAAARRRAASPPRLRASTRRRRRRGRGRRARPGRARAASASAAMSYFRLPTTLTSRTPASRRRTASASVCASAAARLSNAGRSNASTRRPRRRLRSLMRALASRTGTPRAEAMASRFGQISVSISTPTAGSDVAEEAAHRAGHVERQPELGVAVAQQGLPGAAAGGGAMGEQDASAGPRRAQGVQQRRGGARFAERDRVHPDRARRHRPR